MYSPVNLHSRESTANLVHGRTFMSVTLRISGVAVLFLGACVNGAAGTDGSGGGGTPRTGGFSGGTGGTGGDGSFGSGGNGNGSGGATDPSAGSGGVVGTGGAEASGGAGGGSNAGGGPGSGGRADGGGVVGGVGPKGTGGAGGCTSGPVGTISGPLATGVTFLDTAGQRVNAHGGGIIQVGDTFYMHGMTFPATGSDTDFVGFSMYSSKDLATWKNEGIILPRQPSGELGPTRKGERPHIIRCPATGEFVLFAHAASEDYQTDKEVVYATSPTVNGQYTYKGPIEELRRLQHRAQRHERLRRRDGRLRAERERARVPARERLPQLGLGPSFRR